MKCSISVTYSLLSLLSFYPLLISRLRLIRTFFLYLATFTSKSLMWFYLWIFFPMVTKENKKEREINSWRRELANNVHFTVFLVSSENMKWERRWYFPRDTPETYLRRVFRTDLRKIGNIRKVSKMGGDTPPRPVFPSQIILLR